MTRSRIVSTDLASLFREAGNRWGDSPAFATRRTDGSFHAVSYREWCDRSLDLAEALIALGVGPRDHVAILSDNRFEWILADAAVQFCAAADVPRASDVTSEEIAYILAHAGVVLAFVENKAVLAKVLAVQGDLPQLQGIVLMEDGCNRASSPNPAPITVHSLGALEESGRKLRAQGGRCAEERMQGIVPGDLYTLIYTSGTTGHPKGVRLSHRSIMSQVANLPFALSPDDRALSILPVWHVYERVFEMLSIASGLCTYYTSLRHLGEDLKTVKPTIMASAPRLWEGLHHRIASGVEKSSSVKKILFLAAVRSAHGVRRAMAFFAGRELDLEGRSLPQSVVRGLRHALALLLWVMPWLLLDRLFLKKLRAATGGCLRGTISGGGALPPHVDAFFNDIGLPVLEGYGLTESGTVLAVRTWECLVIGTVGPIFPGTQLRIVDPVDGRVLWPDPSRPDKGCGLRGEIQAKGPQLMSGYHRDAERTEGVMRDGWLATGDLGVMSHNGCLKIVGRCKETIVLLGGENVEPLPIESKLLESPLIDQCMVVGQDRKHLGLLVIPSLEGFAEAGAGAPDLPSLASAERTKTMVRAEIRRLVCMETGFKPFERIAAVELLAKPFTAGDELTMTFKLRRHVIAEKHADVIASMFP